ncbi:MAG: phospholipase D-like domain-containing protein [Chthoniobacteraceae bacterium]
MRPTFTRFIRWLQKPKWKLSIGSWIGVVLFLLVALAVFGFFFVRRQIIEYRPAHTFAVSDPAFFGSAHALADPLPLPGNKIELLNNGDEIFPALLGAIAQAQATINFEAYILHSDAVGRQFFQAFMKKAREGIEVRLLLDGMGSGKGLDNEDVESMTAAGCQVVYYHPARSWRVDKLNRRTHRRVLVIDGRVAFTGGVGFSEEWAGNAESPAHWRDLHARIEGPLVAKMQGAFQQHWGSATTEILAGPNFFPRLEPAGDLVGQMTASHSYSLAPIPLLQAVAIAAAEKRIWITNPYCMPTDDQIELLTAAVARGVEVKILVPGKHNDQPATKSAGRSRYGELLRGGVRIFEYHPTMIHQKTMVIDGLFSVFGSSNLDARSAAINEELDITVYDAGFAHELETIFQRDLAHAGPYTLEEFEKRSLWERITEWMTSPFRQQL